MFCAPVFSNTVSQLHLKENCILPFTSMDPDEKGGHFSTVCKAGIHPDHYLDDSISNKGMGGEVHVALKHMRNLNEPGYNVETAWKNEAEALGEINQLHDKHLIRRTGAFKRGKSYYIMFEWADGGNLRDLWHRPDVDSTDLNGHRIMQVLEQLLGLAEALAKLHNKAGNNQQPGDAPRPLTKTETLLSPSSLAPKVRLQVDSGSSGNTNNAGEQNWRHGDLKPENILVFKDAASTWLGTLKIADLGLAKRHEVATSRRVDPTGQKYSTSRYEAPEVVTKPYEPRSRLYDVWSMGCIILEFAIWLLYGHAGLQNLYTEKPPTTKDTLYFTVDSTERHAKVSDIAKRWMDHMLQLDPECSEKSPSVLGDLIRLVMNDLLVVDLPKEGLTHKKGRGDADLLESRLREIKSKANDTMK
ncbi:hypothetical protein ACHAPT_002209 [Fusarium lateritium]